MTETETQECEELANKLLHFLNSCSHHKENSVTPLTHIPNCTH